MMIENFEQLKEIRELEAIPDISFYFFLALSFAAVIFVFALFYTVIGFYKKRKKEDIKSKVLKKLKEIDFNDSKKAAYTITKYGGFLAKDERSKKLLAQLNKRLQKYKYIKNPPEFDDEDIKYYDLFLGSLDE